MDRQTTGLDFAVIGHQDNWANIRSLINIMRTDALEALPVSKIREVYDYIPPRAIFRMHVTSPLGMTRSGLYIETFIAPDKLTADHLRENIQKVRDAVAATYRLGIPMVILGGFTSLLLEGNIDDFREYGMAVTTGNTLTAAYVIKGIEKAVRQEGKRLRDCRVLIIGATGDIGMACTNYLKGKTKGVLLCARNRARLERFGRRIENEGHEVKWSTRIDELSGSADIIISVASSSDIGVSHLKGDVIICDAGYPKNLEEKLKDHPSVKLFHGGMGQLHHGYLFDPDYTTGFYRYPAEHLGHGCIIEVILLALENRLENYTIGKGNISEEKIEEIYALSLKHGITLAPFYNGNGLWPDQ
ncbi:hypothetical protein [Robiginitalea sp. SC105]|uniref:hypothetical protein n=1 Tax=Robiginitalea sp. SC105 TaxID=2762332 RepID=UPI001639E25E|nr:hypothetical protein [Robiginitalea sp. SC105]MBC2838994.1 hypothetical protein [Robiginitalea sp. SC105]